MIFKRRAQKKLLSKIHLAQQEAQAVGKAGHNADEDFEFSRFEDVLAEGKRLLAKHRLVYISRIVDSDIKVGKKGCLATVTIDYAVTDLDGGGSMVIRWVGTGDDFPGGKAIFKAETGTEKYFLARLLQIPFGTDPEEGSSSDTELVIPPEEREPDDDPDAVRAEQDRDAEAPQAAPARHERPLPASDLPAPDWEGLAGKREVVGADA